jgi:hypothetical protein
MSLLSQPGSAPKTWATAACWSLAYSTCHERISHEAAQSMCRACLSAAGEKADFLSSTYAGVETTLLQRTGTNRGPIDPIR